MNKHDIHVQKEDVLRDKYKVLSHIASGGMSEVYLIEQIDNSKKQWAVKIANMTNKLSSKLVDEAKILSVLDHPNLPHIADFFSSDQYFYLVQEYIDGVPLSELFTHQNNKLSIETIIQIGVQLCDALHFLHRQQPPIIYRDIKPGNIMVKSDGTIKLIDFGIARRYQEDRLKDTVQIGTVGFAAPEQFEKIQSDTRTDLFSLGALLYYLLSEGKYVYVAQKPIKTFQKAIPSSLKECVDQLVKLDREDRLQDIREAKILLLKAKEEWQKSKIKQYMYTSNNKSGLIKYSFLSISILLVGYIIYTIIV
ncbi:serine/threonine protein kinase [Virgibacillus ndiopensis]|uniref:serine/threonine protein kinase n=1 Tax=Virgibacillus ndiopensis TaxID=2004408 RepID=UPI000C06BF27|nr:serine/threonine-protein kinase [Virgibacillus ndiopensis]